MDDEKECLDQEPLGFFRVLELGDDDWIRRGLQFLLVIYERI